MNRNKRKISHICMLSMTALSLGLGLLAVSCKTHSEPARAISREIPPYIPPGYYNCIPASMDDLSRSYFSRSGNFDTARQAYDGLIFVFSGVPVQASMIADENTFILGSGRFIAMQPGAVGKLKIGDRIDIVGVNQGPLPYVNGTPIASLFSEGRPQVGSMIDGWLLFTGCIYLPAGAFQLPAPGNTGSVSLY